VGLCGSTVWTTLEFLPRLAHSVREKLRAKFGVQDESAHLAVYGVKGTAVDLVVVGNGQGLGPAAGQNATDLDGAARWAKS